MANTKIPVELSSTPGIVDNSNATAITIDSSENVGINTISPIDGSKLDVVDTDDMTMRVRSTGTSSAAIRYQNSTTGTTTSDGLFVGIDGTTNGYVWNYENLPVLFGTNNAERMRIDSSGNVGIGTSSPVAPLHIEGKDQTEGTARFTPHSNKGNESSHIHFGSTGDWYIRSADTAGKVVINDGGGNVGIGTTSPTEKLTVNGALAITGALSDDRTSTAAMDFSGGVTRFVSYGASGVGGQFAFRTASGGASSTERMRIDGSGNLLVGTTSPYTDSYHTIARNVNDDSGDPVLNVVNLDNTATGFNTVLAVTQNDVVFSGVKAISFRRAGSIIASITMSNSAVAYNTSSDYRLKENIKPIQNGLERLNKLNPVKFNWKEDGTSSEGFIAHEVQEIFSDAISGEKDGEDMQGMDYGRITPLLVKAIQEQQAQIEALQSEINLLKTGE